MAYNDTNYGLDLDFSTDPEERKRRLAMAAALASGVPVDQMAQQAITSRIGQAEERLGQASQLFGVQPSQPVEPIPTVAQTQPEQQQIPTVQPVQPVQTLEQMQQPTVEQPVQPITPEQVATRPEPVQLPQPGEPVQVAGPTQLPTQPQVQPDLQAKNQEAIIAAQNESDPTARRTAFARLLADENVSPENKKLVNQLIAQDYFKEKAISDAEKKIQDATPNDLARYMTSRKEEGSYVKAILLSRLGLTELAKQEQERISPSLKFDAATDSAGNKYTVERNSQGQITRAFTSTGKLASQEEIANLSAAAMPKQAHLLPSVHGGPVQRTNEKGEVEGGMRMYDPQTQSSYVLVGNKRMPDIGWTTPTQTVQNVFGAAQAQKMGAAAGEGFTPQPMKPFPGAAGGAPVAPGAAGGAPVAPGAVAPGGQTSSMPVQRIDADIAGLQREIKLTPSTETNRLSILNQELQKAQATRQQLSGAVPGLPAAPVAGGVPGVGVAQQKTNLAIQEAAEKERIQVAGQRSQAFNKVLDEEVRPQAQQGDTISSTRKQQFAMFDRPGIDVNKIFGLYNASQEDPKNQKLSIVRDILGGLAKPEVEASERLAQLNLSPAEKSALMEYNIANAKINAATLKQTAGPGSVSDAEQRANREMNVNPAKIPALGAYNAMSQSQFEGDKARYKADWALKSTATNAIQLDKEWRKESQELTKIYTDIAKKRIEFITQNGSTTNAVREGYKRFPIPEYDPATESWKKTKPLSEILGR